jgi:hypothetical protein
MRRQAPSKRHAGESSATDAHTVSDADVDGGVDAGATDTSPSASATIPVVPPERPRSAVESAGRVGAVAYPYRIHRARVTVPRPLVGDRTDEFVVSVDRSRRLAVRADVVPETETRTVEDVLVLPSELTDAAADEMARQSVFDWTLRRYSLARPPDIAFERTLDAYKLFWLAERPTGDVILDSVRGEDQPLTDRL